MGVTRRDVIRVAVAAPILGGAAKNPSPTPIVTAGGTRLYPTSAPPQWWTTEPVSGWTYPDKDHQLAIASFGAAATPDQQTRFQDLRNTPQQGAFTRAYFQMTTRPLNGAQTLGGVVSAAIHCEEGYSRLDATLALQVVVHDSLGAVRGIALPVSQDTLEFPVYDPPRSRAAQNWPLQAVPCHDGDVIAINIGISANNQTHYLAYIVGFYAYEDQPTDISRVDDLQLANTWVEFSTQLNFR